jgi:hypothetical protein
MILDRKPTPISYLMRQYFTSLTSNTEIRRLGLI